MQQTLWSTGLPELTGLTIWPELDTISTRERNPILLDKKEADVLNFDIYPYWMERNILEATRKKHKNPKCMQLFERIVFFIASKAGCISHTIPYYAEVLEKGIGHMIQTAVEKEMASVVSENLPEEKKRQIEFYRAVQIALKGVLAYAENLSHAAEKLADKEPDPFKKSNFMEMAEVCRQVPAKPAGSFREAANALWLVHVAIHGENINMAMSPGRLDQILYPYYKKDMAAGRLTLKDTMEIVGCLWLKFNDNTNLVPETAEELFGGAGTVPAVTVGGVDENGNDAVNDLTYIMLRVTELLKTRDPSLNARFNYEKNSPTYRDRVAEVIVNTRSVPAFLNDVSIINALCGQGVKEAHAKDYAIIGCVEPGVPGKSYDASSSIMLNLVSVLELTLNNGKRPITGDEQIGPTTGDPAGFTGFEEFWEAFKKQLAWLIREAVELNNLFGKTYQEIMPSPLLSAFFDPEGPMKKGQDLIFGGAHYNGSGATHIGFADTVDSLNAIEQTIFMDKKATFPELLKALENNFKGHEKLHAWLVNKTPKFGTDNPIAKKNARNLIQFLHNFYQDQYNYRGGRYKAGFWTMTNHAGQGKMSGALPNGRKAYEVFASGLTPVSQAAGDLGLCFKAIAELPGECITNGEAVNFKYPSIMNEQEIRTMAAAVESYFRYGGHHVQFNIMSYEDLIKAKENPEQYPDLLVRVSGYSAYFKDLNEAMKEEIITRTAYDVKTGKAVPFPQADKTMLPFE